MTFLQQSFHANLVQFYFRMHVIFRNVVPDTRKGEKNYINVLRANSIGNQITRKKKKIQEWHKINLLHLQRYIKCKRSKSKLSTGVKQKRYWSV